MLYPLLLASVAMTLAAAVPGPASKREAETQAQARAVFGASPGQYVLQSGDESTTAALASPQGLPPEYLALLQGLAAQQRQQGQRRPQLLSTTGASQFSPAADEYELLLQTHAQAHSHAEAQVTPASHGAHEEHQARLHASLAGRLPGPTPGTVRSPDSDPGLYEQQQREDKQLTHLIALSRSQHEQQQQQQVAPIEQGMRAQAPLVPQQYLRETTEPRRVPARLRPSDLAPPPPTRDEELLAALLSPSPSPGPGAAPPPSRSSIYVSSSTATAASPGSWAPSQPRVSTETMLQAAEEKEVETEKEAALPVVRIASPRGQRPLTQAELQALVEAGFRVTPVGSNTVPVHASPAPDPAAVSYLAVSAKRQRSYPTPAPAPRNHIKTHMEQQAPAEEHVLEQAQAQQQAHQQAQALAQVQAVAEAAARSQAEREALAQTQALIQAQVQPYDQSTSVTYRLRQRKPKAQRRPLRIRVAELDPIVQGLIESQHMETKLLHQKIIQQQQEERRQPLLNLHELEEAYRVQLQLRAQVDETQQERNAAERQPFGPLVVAELPSAPAPRRHLRPRPAPATGGGV